MALRRAFFRLGRVGTKIQEKYEREACGYPVHRAVISAVCGAAAAFYSLEYWLHSKLREAGRERAESSHQAEVADGVQIARTSQQIEHLTHALENAEARRIAENKSIRNTIESLKAQMNSLIASGMHGVPCSPPTSVDEECSDDEECVDRTP